MKARILWALANACYSFGFQKTALRLWSRGINLSADADKATRES